MEASRLKEVGSLRSIVAKSLKLGIPPARLARLLRNGVPKITPTTTHTVSRPYIPKSPGISFQDALKMCERPKLLLPLKSEPNKAHYRAELMEQNVWCRILAARPKMDQLTRVILPSPLMIKIGFRDKCFGPISTERHNNPGPRCYINIFSESLPSFLKRKTAKNQPEYHNYPIVEDYTKELKNVIVKDMKTILDSYKERGSIICETGVAGNGQQAAQRTAQICQIKTADLDLLILPKQITPGEHEKGVRLVGLLYKMRKIKDYCHKNAMGSKTLKR